MTSSMQAAQITHYRQTTPTLQTIPIPTPRDHEVLVKIKAASINPIDLKTMAGGLKLLLTYPMPLTIGSDFAGEVVAVGKRVTQFKVGDAVYGRPQKNHIGTFADYIAVATADIALMPRHLTYQEAAAIPLVGLTSYQALHDLMHLTPGQKVLIQGGAGGIGTIAIPLAKRMGAYVATTASRKNFELVTRLGADRAIDYHTEDFAETLTDYDAVFDTRGGTTLEQAFRVVKPGGTVVSVSGLPTAKFAKDYGLPRWKRALFALAAHKLTRLARQTKTRYHFLFMTPSGRQLQVLTDLIEQDAWHPTIDRTFPLSQVDQALAHARGGHARGKIILNIGE